MDSGCRQASRRRVGDNRRRDIIESATQSTAERLVGAEGLASIGLSTVSSAVQASRFYRSVASLFMQKQVFRAVVCMLALVGSSRGVAAQEFHPQLTRINELWPFLTEDQREELREHSSALNALGQMMSFSDVVDNSFTIDCLLRPVESGRKEFVLPFGDRVLLEVFSEGKLLSELQLAENLAKQKKVQAEKLKRQWQDGMQLVTKSKGRDLGWRKEFRHEFSAFASSIASDLSDLEKQKLVGISARYEMVSLGIPSYLRQKAEALELQKEDVEFILIEIKELANQIGIEGNHLFLNQLEDLLPGYVDQFEDADRQKLPLLPLDIALALAREKGGSLEKINRSSVDFYKIDLDSCQWQFTGPSFTVNEQGEVNVGEYWYKSEAFVPTEVFLARTPDMSSSQLDALRSLEVKILEIYHRKRPPEQAAAAFKKETFERLQLEYEAFRNTLVPIQRQSYSNYLRLHAVFTIGPRYIYEKLKREDWGTQAEFNSRLDRFEKELTQFIEQARSRIAIRLVELVDEKKTQGDGILKQEMVGHPNSLVYSKMLREILGGKMSFRLRR